MKDEESSHAAELNADHGDIDPSFRTGFRGFVIADQSALPHQPAEGALNDPTAWQDFETRGVIGAFDDLDWSMTIILACPLPHLRMLPRPNLARNAIF